MPILITGGTGFIGRHLIRHLLQTEAEKLVVLDADPNPAAIADVADQVELVTASVLELSALIDIIKRYEIESIIHLAYVLGPQDVGLLPMVQVNCIGTINVFEAARLTSIRRVVYLSSAYVYPLRTTLTGPALSEDDPSSPEIEYGACKLFNEQMAKFYARDYGLDTIGLRLTTTFGLGRGQRRGVEPLHFMVLPEFALQGQPVTMPPDDQVADWIYTADAAEAIRLAYQAENPKYRIFNVSGECRRMGEITAYLRDVLPEADISVAEKPHTMPSLLNTKRLRTELGFVPKYSVEEGIAKYLNDAGGKVRFPSNT